MAEFRYDLHIHTKETSKCGHVPAATMVKTYKELGYQGIAITDHLHEEYINTLQCKENWNDCVDAYLTGYRLAKKAAENLDFDVILGMEIRFPQNNNDFLIYGFDESFLFDHPYAFRTNICEFYKAFKDQVLILQAHPYRGGGVDLQPQCLHGLEVINCNPRHDSNNHLAYKLADSRDPGFIRISASDAHRTEDIGRASVFFNHRLKDSFDLAASLQSGKYRMDCPVFSDLLKQHA